MIRAALIESLVRQAAAGMRRLPIAVHVDDARFGRGCPWDVDGYVNCTLPAAFWLPPVGLASSGKTRAPWRGGGPILRLLASTGLGTPALKSNGCDRGSEAGPAGLSTVG